MPLEVSLFSEWQENIAVALSKARHMGVDTPTVVGIMELTSL